MMISSEGFYEMELQGKSAEQIEKVIRELKKEMNALKMGLELPEGRMELCDPSPEVQLKCTREYLDRARKALVEADGQYVPNQAEQRIIDFDNNIEFISKIKFTVGGYFTGNKICTYTIDGANARWDLGGISFVDFKLPKETISTKKELVSAFREFHIGEWKHKYVDPDVLDGTQWELRIEYSNGRKPAEYYGSNAYPFNYEEFAEYMGDIPFVDEDEDEE